MLVMANCHRARSRFMGWLAPFVAVGVRSAGGASWRRGAGRCGRARRPSAPPTTARRSGRPRPAARRGCRARRPGRLRGRRSRRPLEPGQPVGDEQHGTALGDGQQVGVRASAAAGSRCSAGSSRTRTAKPARRARASATRWRWPPDSRRAPGPTAVARPVGQPAEPRAEAHAREDPRPARRRWRRAGRGAGSRPGSCRRAGGPARPAPRLGARRRRPRRSIGHAVERDSAGAGRAGTGRGRRPASTCPLPLGPTSGDAAAGASMRSTPRSAAAARHPGTRPRPSAQLTDGGPAAPTAGSAGRPPAAARRGRRRPGRPHARDLLQAWAAAGSADTSSKAARGTRATTASTAPGSDPPCVARTTRAPARPSWPGRPAPR